uniref:Uncharacterized protein n=1 Tax=Anguilla anguilla TaxID=7936 RepID=A0A0E9T8L2_ANGAN
MYLIYLKGTMNTSQRAGSYISADSQI